MSIIQGYKDYKVNEGGISYDTIADTIFKKLKNERNWENKAEKLLKQWLHNKKDVITEIMNMLRGEDYFDTGEYTFEDNEEYGVKGDIEEDEANADVNKDDESKYVKDDKVVLASIDSTLSSSINSLTTLNDKIESYSKINNKQLISIINNLKSFKASVVDAMEGL